MSECRDCKLYQGNCGHHYYDWRTDHINYEIPNEAMFDGVIGDTPRCFEPSEEYQEMVNMKNAEMIAKYPVEVIKMALAIKEKEDV